MDPLALMILGAAVVIGGFLLVVLLWDPIRALVYKIRAYFTTPRCIYCGFREDQLPEVCEGRHVVGFMHIIERKP